MPRNNEQLQRQIMLLFKFNKLLAEDTLRAMEKLKRQTGRKSEKADHLQEVAFWGKAATSSIFVNIDAVASAMRRMALLFRDSGKQNLTTRDIAKLSGRRYDQDTDSLGAPRPHASSLDSLKQGLRYFAAHIGAEFSLATGDTRWKGLLELQVARRRFTHPESIDDLYSMEMLGTIHSSIVWFNGEMHRFFRASMGALDVDTSGWLPADQGPHVLPKEVGPFTLFTPQEMEEKIVVGGKTLSYVTELFRLMEFESKRSDRIRRKAAMKKNSLGAFARRLVLRVDARLLEARSNAAWFLLESARKVGEVAFSDGDLASEPALPAKLGKLVARVNLWSRLVGSGEQIDVSRINASHLADAWKKRDKLLHPNLLTDLEVSAVDFLKFSIAFKALDCEALRCMQVDPEKWCRIALFQGKTS